MHQINSRGTFMMSKYCVEHLKKSKNPHILNISPPLNMVKILRIINKFLDIIKLQ